MSQRRVLALWLFLVLAVFVGSLLPPSALRTIHYPNLNDKIVHSIAYLVLAFVPVVWLGGTPLAIALATSMAPMGILIEFLQRLVPGRSFEQADILADLIGVTSGVVLAVWIRRNYRINPPSA